MSKQREAITSQITDAGLVAIIRADTQQGLIETCRALAEGGVTVAEITMTTPGALDAIAAATRELGDQCLIGVGSVRDAATVRQAADAGARYVVCPVFDEHVVTASHALDLPVMPGAFTPTEIHRAAAAGADVVKVFPANHLGPRYFKDILAPMPELKLTPTGGVNLDTVADWIDAGAACLGVGSALVSKDLLAAGDWPALRERASQFVKAIRAARA